MVSIKTISSTLQLVVGDDKTVEADIDVNGSTVTVRFDDPNVAKYVTHGLTLGNLLPSDTIPKMVEMWNEAVRTAEKSAKRLEEANAASATHAEDGT